MLRQHISNIFRSCCDSSSNSTEECCSTPETNSKESCCSTDKTSSNEACCSTADTTSKEACCSASSIDSNESCCAPVELTEEQKLCSDCTQKGKKVKIKTVFGQINEPWKLQESSATWFYCSSPQCKTAYYNSEGKSFSLDELREIPADKSDEKNPKICYCFNVRKDDIRADLEKNKKSTLKEFVKAESSKGNCSCETKNPGGSCCLGKFTKTIKELQS